MESVYKNLVGEIARRNIRYKDIAAALGISTRTLYGKLIEESDFKLSEANKIHAQFFPDVDKDYLFQRDT